MFELFGLYSNETGKNVHKNLIRFMGLHKKNGWDDCNILKNSWITLRMKAMSAETWAKNMKSPETPGDEIALHALCKMYRRHAMVYTKMNIWSTVKTDSPIPEEQLIKLCDVRLLFIEEGVFGELQIIPYAPPPGPVYGDAQEDLDDLPNYNDKELSPPLDLSNTVTQPAPSPSHVIGENDIPIAIGDKIN